MKKIVIVIFLACGITTLNASKNDELDSLKEEKKVSQKSENKQDMKFSGPLIGYAYAPTDSEAWKKIKPLLMKNEEKEVVKKSESVGDDKFNFEPIEVNGKLYLEVTSLEKKEENNNQNSSSDISERLGTHFTWIDPIGPNKGVVSMPPLLGLHYIFN